jgi:hypothetical protein
MIAGITTSGESLRWVMKPTPAAIVAGRLLGAGIPTNLPISLLGIPVVLSSSAPAQITLIDCSAILYSDNGGFDVDTSESATVEMDSSPADPTTSATVLVSLFQRNCFSIRAARYLAYQRALAGSVVYMTVAY